VTVYLRNNGTYFECRIGAINGRTAHTSSIEFGNEKDEKCKSAGDIYKQIHPNIYFMLANFIITLLTILLISRLFNTINNIQF
jgi:hypothetical protein